MKQKKKTHSVARQWLVPGKHNAHRPHLLRKHGLLTVAVLLIGLQFLYNFVVVRQPDVLGYATNVSSNEVTKNLNNARLKNNLKALTPDSQLSKAASLKADDMLQKGYWAHNSPEGTQPWVWFEQAGYAYSNAGENLAKDFRTSEGVTSAWLNSETHRRNMLNPAFQNIGIAVVNGTLNNRETTLVVALFGTKQPASEASSTGATAITSSSSTNVFANPAQINMLLNPASVATLTILLVLLVIALLTHWHYIKLPKPIRKAWYKHHALYTAIIALLSIAYIAYIFTSGSI